MHEGREIDARFVATMLTDQRQKVGRIRVMRRCTCGQREDLSFQLEKLSDVLSMYSYDWQENKSNTLKSQLRSAGVQPQKRGTERRQCQPVRYRQT